MAAVNYLAIVDSSAGEGTFDLGLTLDTPAAEDVCASAAALTAGTLSGNLAGFVNDYGSASKDGVATGETGAYTNNTTAAQDVFVIVGNYADSASTDFSMTTTIAAAPAGETCANAVPVTATSMIAMETLLGASSDTTFDLPRGKPPARPRLRGHRAGRPDHDGRRHAPRGRQRVPGPSCTGVSTCLSNVNAAGAGMPETATYMNSGMAPATVFVQVFGVPPGGYGINFTIQ